jgi:hypothetical protein
MRRVAELIDDVLKNARDPLELLRFREAATRKGAPKVLQLTGEMSSALLNRVPNVRAASGNPSTSKYFFDQLHGVGRGNSQRTNPTRSAVGVASLLDRVSSLQLVAQSWTHCV